MKTNIKPFDITDLQDQVPANPKTKKRLNRFEKQIAAQMFQLGVSRLKISKALNRNVKAINRFISRTGIEPNGSEGIRRQVSEFLSMADPIAATVHVGHMIGNNPDLSSKHSLAHLKGTQYLTEQTQSIITTISEDQLNKSLADTMVAALKATATDAEVQQTDSVQEIAQSNSVQAAPKKPYNNGHGKGRRAHRAVDYPRARKQHSNSAQVNGDSIEPRGDPTSVTGEG
jgi:hypothetical protein